MKKFILATGLITGMYLSIPFQARSQVHVNINIQPAWGPVGYDYVEYYYLPDIDMYYYVPSRQYVYFSRGQWIWASSLPYWCDDYNIYAGYKVIINEPRAYLHYSTHHVKYAKYKNCHGKQLIIKNNSHNVYNNHRTVYKAGNGHVNKTNGNGKSYGNSHGNGNAKGSQHHGKGHH